MVTKGREYVVPRWASDPDYVLMIAKKQQDTIEPDAIFGRIDPRDTTKYNLSEMFKPEQPQPFRKYMPKRRNSNSARAQWNDHSEFATPNVMAKADNYLINLQNVNKISSFNPFKVPERVTQSRFNTKAKEQSLDMPDRYFQA